MQNHIVNTANENSAVKIIQKPPNCIQF